MPKRKSPENTEGKDGSKTTKQEPTRRSARLSAVMSNCQPSGSERSTIPLYALDGKGRIPCEPETPGGLGEEHKPAPPKPEPKARKTSAKKEPGTKINKGAKGKKEEKQEAGKEGTAPSENGETRAEEVQKTESVDNEGE